MNTISMKNGEIRQIAIALEGLWGDIKQNLKVSGKTMYNVIALRRTLTEQAQVIQETFYTIGQNNGGTATEDGGLKIPDENIPEVNRLLNEVANTEQEISYNPIVITDNDEVPADFLELLFDFISME